MKLPRNYNALEAQEKIEFLARAKELFRPILTHWTCFEAGGEAVLQLELIDRIFQPILHHKIRFDTYGSDRLIAQQRLILHRVQFQTQKATGEIGDFRELSLSAEQLFTIVERLNATVQSCQVLLIDANILQILQLDCFQSFLPDKLKKIDFGLMALKQWDLAGLNNPAVEKTGEDGSFSELA